MKAGRGGAPDDAIGRRPLLASLAAVSVGAPAADAGATEATLRLVPEYPATAMPGEGVAHFAAAATRFAAGALTVRPGFDAPDGLRSASMLRAVSEAAVFQLSALPPLLFSRGQLGFTESTEEERTKFAPAAQRLVRRHPGSGRLPLYLSSHIGRVRGWQGPEALTLIRGLTEHATQREIV